MTKDKALEDLFLTQKPHFDDHDAFMANLTKRLDAVEFIHQQQEATIRRYKMAMIVAFIVGILSGAITMAFILSTPADVPLFTFQVQTSFLLWFTEISRPVVAAALALLMTIGIVSVIINIQDINTIMNMNKKTIITIMLALVTMTGQAQAMNYTIQGNLSEVVKATAKQGVSFDSVTIVNTATNEVISKQAIQDGVFTIKGTIDKPFYALLCIWSSAEVNGDRKSKKSRIPIIIESGDIIFDGNRQTPVISGTPLNDMLSEVISKHNTPDFTETLKGLFIQHKDDVAAIPLLLMLDDSMMEPEVLLSLINQTCAEVQNHPNVLKVKEKAEAELSQKEGEMFKDFAVEYNGKTTRFSDYVGRGQYVLADFWASWCGPCRQQIPDLIGLYQQYKEKGLTVLGIAFRDKPEDTEKAIRDLGIPYPQIINAQDIPATLYGIDALPHIILFAPDGTIIARNIYGEELKEKLTEIFQ